MEFNISESQRRRFTEWQDAIKKIHGEYGLYEFRFAPNGIGMEVIVYSHVLKTTIDLTEVDKW